MDVEKPLCLMDVWMVPRENTVIKIKSFQCPGSALRQPQERSMRFAKALLDAVSPEAFGMANRSFQNVTFLAQKYGYVGLCLINAILAVWRFET